MTTGAFGFWVYQEKIVKKRVPLPSLSLTPSLPSPITAPSPESTIPPDWKTYSNNELSFKHPPDWITEINRIIATSLDIVIYIVTKDSTLMNECMKLDTTEKKNGFVIKKFSRVTTGAMCSTNDSSRREIWVVPTENDYSPGINYSYTVKDNPQAKNIFNQILSTFKFTNINNVGQKKCAAYTKNGITKEHCAICGNGICEDFERCTSSGCESDYYLPDCGILFCPEDCD